MAVQARTLELYGQLGLSDTVLAAGYPDPSVNIWAKGKRRRTWCWETRAQALHPTRLFSSTHRTVTSYCCSNDLLCLVWRWNGKPNCLPLKTRATGSPPVCGCRRAAKCDTVQGVTDHAQPSVTNLGSGSREEPTGTCSMWL